MKKINSRLCLSLIIILYTISNYGGTAFAAVDTACQNSFLGFPSWYQYLDVRNDGTGCKIVGPSKVATDNSGNPISNEDGTQLTTIDVAAAAPKVILAIIDILMRLAGVVAFAYLIISGFKFVTSQGNPEKEKAARQTIINALIGLVISILAIGLTTGIGRYLAS